MVQLPSPIRWPFSSPPDAAPKVGSLQTGQRSRATFCAVGLQTPSINTSIWAHLTYRIDGALASLPAEYSARLRQRRGFILATNQRDTEALSDAELLQAYKAQQRVARGFRFLKDPLFLAASLFLKSPQRLMALMLVMTLCLLVYAALEHRIRERLKAQEHTFPHQTGKPVDNLTARWVFQYFVGIHLLILADGQALVLNLDEHHQSLLELLGLAYEAFYS